MANPTEPTQSDVDAQVEEVEQSISKLWQTADELKAQLNKAVVLYLREPSRHWPRKIGDFQRDDTRKLWIYEGRAIPLKEWNETEVEIWTKIEREYDYLKTGIQIETLPAQAEDPSTQHPNLIQYQKPKDESPEVIEEPPAPTLPDEQSRTEERPSEETLY